jgi:hypothetical protein
MLVIFDDVVTSALFNYMRVVCNMFCLEPCLFY